MTIVSRLAILSTIALCGCSDGDGQNADAQCASMAAAMGQPCPGPDGATCFIEGHATCDPPGVVSGGCTCTTGSWSCFSSCPAGCPATRPAQGGACSLTADTECPYEGGFPRILCTCDGSHFDCK